MSTSTQRPRRLRVGHWRNGNAPPTVRCVVAGSIHQRAPIMGASCSSLPPEHAQHGRHGSCPGPVTALIRHRDTAGRWSLRRRSAKARAEPLPHLAEAAWALLGEVEAGDRGARPRRGGIDRRGGDALLLHYACKHNHLEALELLLSDEGLDINAKSPTGWTPLHVACVSLGVESVTRLLADGRCDAAMRTTHEGWTALHLACMSRPTALDPLLAAWRDATADSPLGKASSAGQAAALIGLDLNARDVEGRTALHHCWSPTHLHVLERLIQEPGLLLDVADNQGRTPFASYCGVGNLGAARRLAAIDGVQLNALDDDGWPALARAVNGGHDAVVDWLLDPTHGDVGGSELGPAGLETMALAVRLCRDPGHAARHGMLQERALRLVRRVEAALQGSRDWRRRRSLLNLRRLCAQGRARRAVRPPRSAARSRSRGTTASVSPRRLRTLSGSAVASAPRLGARTRSRVEVVELGSLAAPIPMGPG